MANIVGWTALVESMKLAKSAGDAQAAEIAACEAVVLAETKDHLDWELLGKCAEHLPGTQADALKSAYDTVEDRNGVIYRVTYTGTPNGQPPSAIPAGPMLEQAARGDGVPLASERPETAAQGTVDVSSPAFADGGAIPVIYSEYEQGVSFPLEGSVGPTGTVSYLLIMEDPDAAKPKPFVHWVAWNIPASVTGLREGLQEQDLLIDPPGLRQGVNSRGTVGYLGPRPPAGDPPHMYHVQVFALDAVLDMPFSGADRDQVLAAAKGHVLARGELTGTFARPAGQVSRP